MDGGRVLFSEVVARAARRIGERDGLLPEHPMVQWEAMVNWEPVIDELALPVIRRWQRSDGEPFLLPATLASQLDGRLVTVPLVVVHEGVVCAVTGRALPWGDLENGDEAMLLRLKVLPCGSDLALVAFDSIDWEH
jgi:hypothetical protein